MANDARPKWEQLADQLTKQASGATDEQIRIASALGIALAPGVPAPVAAVVLRDALSSVLYQGVGRAADLPDTLFEIEQELGITTPAHLITGSRQEVSAWFSARYMEMTARGLRELRPEVGDVVSLTSGVHRRRIISSISDSGRVYFKGRPTGSAWPNHLKSVSRVGEPQNAKAVSEVDSALRNATVSTSTNFAKFAALQDYLLETNVTAPEAVRALEELLDSGEEMEAPFQVLLTRYPELLASVVMGGWRTYVIPQKRLGAEYIPDFLVLGINSIGPQWVSVEIEAARHPILNKDGSLSTPTRHAVNQVRDWREWLTTNVAYAQSEHGLYGLTNRAPGLVIIGRDNPSAERQSSRAQSEEDARIAIHSWDWLLRQAKNQSGQGLQASEFAVHNARDRAGASWIGPLMTPDVIDNEESDDDDVPDFDALLSSMGN